MLCRYSLLKHKKVSSNLKYFCEDIRIETIALLLMNVVLEVGTTAMISPAIIYSYSVLDQVARL